MEFLKIHLELINKMKLSKEYREFYQNLCIRKWDRIWSLNHKRLWYIHYEAYPTNASYHVGSLMVYADDHKEFKSGRYGRADLEAGRGIDCGFGHLIDDTFIMLEPGPISPAMAVLYGIEGPTRLNALQWLIRSLRPRHEPKVGSRL